ncbi:uncharacterized protein LOC123313497 [Coccinella septempunctata]|uniref:uncharacterized protein LOC123313497 n=1 Tax=Coccinella septempunctata TaxID=41139 RepID=UPI001D07AA41|nr:uncharacterized protein LOC123313497 [Coccinella septempunctata]
MFCSNPRYDQRYYPLADNVRLLSENEWNIPYAPRPAWLGFNHENKPFKLENVPYLRTSKYPRVEKVINPYLKRAFELKKAQCLGSQIMVGFHATRGENIKSIVENNFNWRLAGRNRGFKHGKGVCFSKNDNFALQFCKSQDKRIIQAEFLCGSVEIGYTGDTLPRFGSDTSKSPNGNVWVKFDDNEFLPSYVYYCNIDTYSVHLLGDDFLRLWI